MSELVSPDAGASSDIAARSISIVLGVGGSWSGFSPASFAIGAGSSSASFASLESNPLGGSGNASVVRGKGQASGVVAVSRKVAGISPLVRAPDAILGVVSGFSSGASIALCASGSAKELSFAPQRPTEITNRQL